MDFYLVLAEIMKEKGLTIAQVAKLCGLTDSTVRSVFLRKSKNVSLETAFKLSDGLDVSLERLNGDKKESPTPEEPKVEDIRKERIIRNYDQLNEKGRDALADYSNYQLTINKKEETVRVQAIARGGARVESEITLQEKKEILEEIDRMQKDIPDF